MTQRVTCPIFFAIFVQLGTIAREILQDKVELEAQRFMHSPVNAV